MLGFRVGALLGLACVLGYTAGCGSKFSGDEPATSGGAGTHAGGRGGSTGKGGGTGKGGNAATGGDEGMAGDPGSSAGEPGTGGVIEPGGSGGLLNAGSAGLGGSGGLVNADCALNLAGPSMIAIPSSEGSTYCVDSTEVTVAQYAEFLSIDVGNVVQPAICTWNATFVPLDGWPPASGTEDYPVTFVDWCDAFAYCTWAGKHLCGKVGGGGPNAPADAADPAKSQWYNACSASGQQDYPYGSTYEPSVCNGADYPSAETVLPVSSLAGCHGGVGDLHDMSGNVWEWEDSCVGESGMTDTCLARGGAYDSNEVALTCGHSQSFYRNALGITGGYIGFRCCAF